MHISELTIENVTPVIREIVAEYGEDYIYPREECVYRADGSPSCIVGHVLDRMGVTYESWWDDGGSVTVFSLFNGKGGDTDLKFALDAAQSTQDARGTWGNALAIFEQLSVGR